MTDDIERPSIEFEGKRYERRDGMWFGVLTHMKAAVYLSQRIDVSAKIDQTLWERCNDQDFADDPKNRSRGRVLAKGLGISPDELFGESETQPIQTRPAGGRIRRSRIGENVRVSFRNKDRELVVHCDIEAGWRETGNGWVFQESDRVDFVDQRLRISAKFAEHTLPQWYPRKITLDSPVAESRSLKGVAVDDTCPSFRPEEHILAEDIRLLIDGSTGTFAIRLLDGDGKLNPALQWRPVRRHWRFKSSSVVYETPIRMEDVQFYVSRPFSIEIEGVLRELPHPTLPPEYAEKTPFASGGLPSLGKRR